MIRSIGLSGINNTGDDNGALARRLQVLMLERALRDTNFQAVRDKAQEYVSDIQVATLISQLDVAVRNYNQQSAELHAGFEPTFTRVPSTEQINQYLLRIVEVVARKKSERRLMIARIAFSAIGGLASAVIMKLIEKFWS